MKKIVLSAFIFILMALSLNMNPSVANAQPAFAIGDYIQMGYYYDVPIIWRCVDIDENGPLMLSDKVLCMKPFDAAGIHTNDYNNYRAMMGSNLWETSNIRSWLNSSARGGAVQWICGNVPIKSKLEQQCNNYEKENGFLSNDNFTQKETNAIKSVTQKSLLPEIDINLKVGGKEQHFIFDRNTVSYQDDYFKVENIIKNYDTAYYDFVTDKMFLLDVKQINKVYLNRSVLGDDYFMAKPTKNAVENSQYADKSISPDKSVKYWLRSPYANKDNLFNERTVGADGLVKFNMAFDGTIIGVRPAFYIDLTAISFKSGNGTYENKYVVDNGETAPHKTPTAKPTAVLTAAITNAASVSPTQTNTPSITMTAPTETSTASPFIAPATTDTEDAPHDISSGSKTLYIILFILVSSSLLIIAFIIVKLNQKK